MRIVFMGTPDFAVASLKKLVEAGKSVVGVVTAPDKPAGRGRKVSQSAVKEYALSQNLPVFQPTNLKDPSWIKELEGLKPDLQVVVAFRMLPEVVWSLPTKGTINLHGSLLPEYRGAAPINWAIINGEKQTGVTTFFINENIDTGAIIDKAVVKIAEDDTAGSLHDKLMETGATLLLDTVTQIENGKAVSQPQELTSDTKHAPKIFKEDTRIDFSKPANEVYNFIRGLSPYPAATCNLIMDGNSYPLKIYQASVNDVEKTNANPGKIETDNRKIMTVLCGKGALNLHVLQLSGKKRMEVHELLNGFKLNADAFLE